MSQININGLCFCYDGSSDNIFENVSFSIDTNWKVGLIGRNGKGKTTFLKLLMGKYSFRGSITASTLFEYFPYTLSDEQISKTASEFIDEIKPGCEEWRVICELQLLDEEADILYRPFNLLSHGQRTKVLLAVLFSGENEFLLIDEPTNHLDSGAREKIREYLSSKSGFILVSHDRDFLDACVDHVLVFNRESIDVQNGNFSSWWENKQRADSFSVSENEKHQKEIKKLKQTAKRTSEWADKNESTKIGYDPIKEHDRCISTRAYIGGKTGTYLLYTITRINSIIRKTNTENADMKVNSLHTDAERELILAILLTGDVFRRAIEEKAPNYICDNAYKLAVSFSKFYHDNHILGETDEAKKNDWLALISFTRKLILRHLDILAIEPVENM